jgi:hypothetical protein
MAYRRGRRRGTSLLWAALIIASLCVYALPRLGTFLLVSDEPSPADATFLSYGVSIRRAALDAAAQRHRAGESPAILLGALNARDAEHYVVPHSSELARQYLIDAGVPAAAIEVLPSVDSEIEEAEGLRDALASHPSWQRVVAYVPDFRARRSAGVLKHTVRSVSPPVELRVVAVRDPEVRLERWWETRPGINVIWNEYPRLLYYALRGRL